jgi:hypothetical protein
VIDYERLETRAEEQARLFREARPVEHLVVDSFLREDAADLAHRAFPPLSAMDALHDFRQDKAQDPEIGKFDPVFASIVFEHLHSPRLRRWLEAVTGMRDLRGDPQLYASGLAQGGHGSFLNVHLDNSSHPVQPWYRRLNLLVYLNPRWNDAKGGHLELWSEDMRTATAILPVHNRMVIFATHRRSWHGYRRVDAPDGDTRKSINIYYFNEDSPEDADYYHVTSFRARRGERWNRLLYPIDNWLRTAARRLRLHRDKHAVLYGAGRREERGSGDGRSG